ncbi:MAG: DNA-directed RNA polymerase subunit beta', partial [Pseudomonadota bacterium]|nr:DNA-directed RNA polymerase subunit beta' [Pseudomonadota bacterium]
FNADFDGDQMAVHLPLSAEAQAEARVLMLSANNVLSPANGRPLSVPSQDMVIGVYYLTEQLPDVPGQGRKFSHVWEAERAYEDGEVSLHAAIEIRDGNDSPQGDGKPTYRNTTVGRLLFEAALPAGFCEQHGYIDRSVRKRHVTDIVEKLVDGYTKATVAESLDAIKDLGFRYASQSGLTISMDDVKTPPEKPAILDRYEKEADKIEAQFKRGIITDDERRQKEVEIWINATEEVRRAMEHTLRGETFNPIDMMVTSGARGNIMQVSQIAGMRGLVANPRGEIIPRPIKSNFREGMSVLEYFISTHGARKGLADTALRTADSGYLTRRLVDVAQELIIREEDCGTTRGLWLEQVVPDGPGQRTNLETRLYGRVLADDITLSDGSQLAAGTHVGDAEMAVLRDDEGLDRVRVRSVLTCEATHGVCGQCYGRSLATGRAIELGEAVGVIAAQSIGEPGTQLTMRTFHIGGAASRTAAASQLESKSAGVVRFSAAMRYVTNGKGELIVIARSGEVMIHDDNGRERERHKVPYGATMLVKDGDTVKAGKVLATWDATSRPIITEYAGRVKFENVEEGVTVAKQVDEVTGLSTLVVIDPKRRAGAAAKGVRPQVKLLNDRGDEVKLAGSELPVNITFQLGSIITVKDGQDVAVGEVLARIPQETSKTRDITGGLPRVAELFEARAPKDAGTLAEVTGTVSFGKDTKGKQRLVITDLDGVAHEYLIPKDKHVTAHDGQVVNKGESIVDGPADPHDILRLLGVEALARYITDEVQDVYRLQGVKINDKHIEVIVRQMLRRVQVQDAGDTRFIVGEQVERSDLLDENDKVLANGGVKGGADAKRPATYEHMLLGITKASLSTDSFISAASFQETTRVLTEAAIMGKKDELRGLKENVIVGRLIPAGTGLAYHNARKKQKAGGLPEVAPEGIILEAPAAEISADAA